MAIYVLADLHLSFGVSKPMDIFPGWENHAERIEKNWQKACKRQQIQLLFPEIFHGGLHWMRQSRILTL